MGFVGAYEDGKLNWRRGGDSSPLFCFLGLSGLDTSPDTNILREHQSLTATSSLNRSEHGSLTARQNRISGWPESLPSTAVHQK